MHKKLLFALILCLFSFNTAIFAQNNGDYRTVDFASGSWTDPTMWEIYNAGTTSWESAVTYPSGSSVAVSITGILSEIVYNTSNLNIGTLTVGEGCRLYAGTPTTKSIRLYGNLVCDGVIGDGANNDGISLMVEGNACTISGSGSIDVKQLLKAISNNSTTLNIQNDVTVRGTGTVVYSLKAGYAFNINVAAGATLNIPNGNISIDGPTGTGTGETFGTYTISGTLNVGNTLYLTTNNATNACTFAVASTGVVNTYTVKAPASGLATHVTQLSSGALFNITNGYFEGTGTATNNTYNFNANSVVQYSKAGDQTINFPALIVPNRLKITGSGLKTLSSNITVDGIFELDGSSTFTLGSGITLGYGAAGTLEYTGMAAQNTGYEWSSLNPPYNVKIDNPNGVTLTEAKSIAGTLTFTRGKLNGSAFTLTLGSAGTISGERSGNYFVGKLKTTRTVGTGSSTFGGLGITLAAGSGENLGDVTVTRTSGSAAIVTMTNGSTSIARKWEFTNTGSATFASREIQCSWPIDDDNNKQLNQMRLYSYDSGLLWTDLSGAPTVVSGSDPRVITANLTSFNNKVLTVSDDLNPLPVELASFTAANDNNTVKLNWLTKTEKNNYGFEIERAVVDATGKTSEFTKIGFVNGNGNSNSPKQYQFTDNKTVTGKYAYRLRQIDNDGQFNYSSVIEVAAEKSVNNYSLESNYPNPFNPSTTIRFAVPNTSHVILKVYNSIGEEVVSLVNEVLEKGIYERTFNASSLSSGNYFYSLEADGVKLTKKMLLVK